MRHKDIENFDNETVILIRVSQKALRRLTQNVSIFCAHAFSDENKTTARAFSGFAWPYYRTRLSAIINFSETSSCTDSKNVITIFNLSSC